MSKAANTRQVLLNIGNDAIEQVRCGGKYAEWLHALATAIDSTLRYGPAVPEVRLDQARALASIGQYLAAECDDVMSTRAKDLQQQLDAAEDQE